LESSQYNDVRLSPEAGSVAIQDVMSGQDLWVYEIGRGSSTRLSHRPTVDETMLMRLQTASDDDPFRGLDYFHVVVNWFDEVRERVPIDN